MDSYRHLTHRVRNWGGEDCSAARACIGLPGGRSGCLPGLRECATRCTAVRPFTSTDPSPQSRHYIEA